MNSRSASKPLGFGALCFDIRFEQQWFRGFAENRHYFPCERYTNHSHRPSIVIHFAIAVNAFL
jgi:hypothetical protein